MVASPTPCASSHALIVAVPSSTEVIPLRSTPSLAEATYGALPMNASGHVDVSSVGAMLRRREPLVRRLLDGRDVEAVDAGELEVALVAARHGHDRPGAVAHQHVVGDPDRDVLAGDRVRGVAAGEHAGLRAVLVLALDVLARRRPGAGRPARPRPRRPSVRSATSGCSGASTMNVAPNSVSGRVVKTVIGPAGDGEVDARAVAAADPVALHRLQRVASTPARRGRR